MASKRVRLREARHAVLRDLIGYLERDRTMSDTDQVLVIETLIEEFRRRAGIAEPGFIPEQEALPGLNLFRITLLDGGND